MACTPHRLTARQVTTIITPGRHADGGGLHPRVTPQGARSWLSGSVVGKTRKEIGPGPASAVPLATVRRIAAEMRETAATGGDPLSVRDGPAAGLTPAAPAIPTFGAFAET